MAALSQSLLTKKKKKKKREKKKGTEIRQKETSGLILFIYFKCEVQKYGLLQQEKQITKICTKVDIFSLCPDPYFAQELSQNRLAQSKNSYFARLSENSYFAQDNSGIYRFLLCAEQTYGKHSWQLFSEKVATMLPKLN